VSDELKLGALGPSDLQKLMKQAGSEKITKAVIQEHIDKGAPVNDDGTINLIEYGAWLIHNIL